MLQLTQPRKYVITCYVAPSINLGQIEILCSTFVKQRKDSSAMLKFDDDAVLEVDISGKAIAYGVTNLEHARVVATKFIDYLKSWGTIGIYPEPINFQIARWSQTMCFPDKNPIFSMMNLFTFVQSLMDMDANPEIITYEPELYPAIVWHLQNTMTTHIFPSGKVIVTGKNIEIGHETYMAVILKISNACVNFITEAPKIHTMNHQ